MHKLAPNTKMTISRSVNTEWQHQQSFLLILVSGELRVKTCVLLQALLNEYWIDVICCPCNPVDANWVLLALMTHPEHASRTLMLHREHA